MLTAYQVSLQFVNGNIPRNTLKFDRQADVMDEKTRLWRGEFYVSAYLYWKHKNSEVILKQTL